MGVAEDGDVVGVLRDEIQYEVVVWDVGNTGF